MLEILKTSVANDYTTTAIASTVTGVTYAVDGIEKSVTAEKSDAPKTGSHVSLRDLVLACIETIGRKYFEAKELYAFAPIFKACMPHCPNLEEALKQELHELVKEHLLDTLPDDCYCVK